MSCAESAGCSSLWDQYCPPPLNLHIPRGTWANLDYLMWWSRGASLPPLVTTGSQGGALNDPNLKILYGNDRVENTIRSGGRLNIGTWFNPQQTFGIGATFLQLQNMASNYTDVSNGSPIIARPFFNTATQAPDSLVYRADGHIRRRSSRPRDRQLRGRRYVSASALIRRQGYRLDLVYGWRYLQLSDSVNIDDKAISTDPSNPEVPLGTTLIGFDGFRTTNKFNGGTIGFMSERRRGIWYLSTVGKISLGNMHQTAIINGYSSTTVPGQPPANFTGDRTELSAATSAVTIATSSRRFPR